METVFQKYLHGYEISPHPDVRKKAATYMLNLNPYADSEKSDIHTHLLKFSKGKSHILDFWKNNLEIDRCWVPWDWCESVIQTTKNNSIILFAPSDDTMHAIKLNYDHLKFQRTQIYGNLWYNESTAIYPSTYKDLQGEFIDAKELKKKKIKEHKSKVKSSFIRTLFGKKS